MSLDTTALEGQTFDLEDCDLSDLAVWIDPIDATSQYIKGGQGLEEEGVPTKGLPVVTVLLGAFLKSSGQPVLGVVNQPFATASGGRHHWAVHTSGDADLKMRKNMKKLFAGKGWIHSPSLLAKTKTDERKTPILLVGSSESSQLLERFSSNVKDIYRSNDSNYYLENISSNNSKPVFSSQAFSTLACGKSRRRWPQTFDGSNIHRIFVIFHVKSLNL